MRQPHFAPNSRYFATATAVLQCPDGTEVVYLLRRFCPSPEGFAVVAEHIHSGDERLDHIAAQHFGDPERFWLLCDANNVINPSDLIAVAGTSILITLPDGVPGAGPVV